MTTQTHSQADLEWYMLGFSSSIITGLFEKIRKDPVRRMWIISPAQEITDLDAPMEPHLMCQLEQGEGIEDVVNFYILTKPVTIDADGNESIDDEQAESCFAAMLNTAKKTILYYSMDESIGEVVYDMETEDITYIKAENDITDPAKAFANL